MRSFLWSIGLFAAIGATAGAQQLEDVKVKPVEKPAAGADAKRDAKGAAQLNGQAARQSNAMFSAIDADANGIISKVELRKAIKALMALDADKDGNITLAEAGGGAAGAAGPLGEDPQVAQLMTYDKNGDGKLSVNEVPNDMRNMLRGVDQNNDNSIDRQELTAAMANMRNQFNAGPGGRWPGAGAAGTPEQATAQFLQYDRNGDGRLTANELPQQASRALQGADRNKDGSIDAGELQAAIAQMGNRAKALGAGIDPGKGRGFPDRERKGTNN